MVDLTEIKRRHTEGLEYRGQFEGQWMNAKQKYDGGLFYWKEWYTWQASMCVPHVYTDVMRMVSKELKTYFRGRLSEVDYVNPNDRERADKTNVFLQRRLKQVSQWYKKWQQYLMWRFREGTGIVKVYWDSGSGMPCFDAVDPMQFVIEPCVSGVEEAEFCMHDVSKGLYYIRAMFENGEWEYDNIAGSAEEAVEALKSGSSIEERNQLYNNKSAVLVTEYWSRDQYAIVLNDKFIVRDGANPYEITINGKKQLPFCMSVCTPILGETWGVGLYTESMLKLTDLNDKTYNQSIDLMALTMNPELNVTMRAGLSGDTIIKRPGAIRHLKSLGEVARESYGEAISQNNNVKGLLDRTITNTTGLTEFATGVISKSMADNATSANILSEAAEERLSMYMINDEDMFKRFTYIWLSLEKQYMGEDGFLSKFKEKGVYKEMRINKDDILLEGDIVINSPNQIVDAKGWYQLNQQMYQMLQNDPRIDKARVLKNMLESSGYKDTEGVFMDDEEMVQNAAKMYGIKKMTEGEIAKIDRETTPEAPLGVAANPQSAPLGMPNPPQQGGALVQPNQAMMQAANV